MTLTTLHDLNVPNNLSAPISPATSIKKQKRAAYCDSLFVDIKCAKIIQRTFLQLQ